MHLSCFREVRFFVDFFFNLFDFDFDLFLVGRINMHMTVKMFVSK